MSLGGVRFALEDGSVSEGIEAAFDPRDLTMIQIISSPFRH